MEAQSKSSCKSEEEHNDSESQNFEDLDMKAMIASSDAEKENSCLKTMEGNME